MDPYSRLLREHVRLQSGQGGLDTYSDCSSFTAPSSDPSLLELGDGWGPSLSLRRATGFCKPGD